MRKNKRSIDDVIRSMTPLEHDELGMMRGGFATLEPGGLTASLDSSSNNVCPANGKCANNGICASNGKCRNNGYCDFKQADKEPQTP